MIKKLLIGLVLATFLIGIAYATVITGNTVEEGTMLGFAWDANQETDLAGYRIFRFDNEFGDVSVATPLIEIQCAGGDTSAACTTWQTDTTPIGTWYWKIVAFDTADQQSPEAENILKRTVVAYNPPPAPVQNWRWDITP